VVQIEARPPQAAPPFGLVMQVVAS